MNNLPSVTQVLNSPSFVVCLKRNKARFFHTKKLLNKAGFKNVFPFEAVDGVSMRDSDDEWDRRLAPIAKSLGLPDKHMEGISGGGGQFGITLSTLTLWGWLAISNKPGMMVFEDDALPRPDFPKVFPAYWESIVEPHLDMVYVGSQVHPNDLENHLHSSGYYVNSPAQCLHAYYVTRDCAKKVLDFLPVWAKCRQRHIEQKNTNIYGPIDTFLNMLHFKDRIANGLKAVGLDEYLPLIPDLRSVSLLGSKVPVEGEYKGYVWEGRDDGIIHQNADLGSNLHGLNVSRMRKEEETAARGKDVFHDGIFKIDEETGEGYIDEKV